jgi:hypothetical protein
MTLPEADNGLNQYRNMETSSNLDEFLPLLEKKNKRSLLPLWIKIFIWLFILQAFLLPLVVVARLFGIQTPLALYGFTSYDPFNLMGIFLIALMAFKGVVALALWLEKEWAVTLALIDGWLGVFICVLTMTFLNNRGTVFRLELFALIPYIMKMSRIRAQWQNEFNFTLQETIPEDTEDTETEKPIHYKTVEYPIWDGLLTIEQQFEKPNIGEKVLLDGKIPINGKYRLGFMSYVEVENGFITGFSLFY